MEDFYGTWQETEWTASNYLWRWQSSGNGYRILSDTGLTQYYRGSDHLSIDNDPITVISRARNTNGKTKKDYPVGFVVQRGDSGVRYSYFMHKDKGSFVVLYKTKHARATRYVKIDPSIAQAEIAKIPAILAEKQRQEQNRRAALKQGVITLEGTATLSSTESNTAIASPYYLDVTEIDGDRAVASKSIGWTQTTNRYTVPAGTHNISFAFSITSEQWQRKLNITGVIRYTFAADREYEIVASYGPDWIWTEKVTVFIQEKTK
jgi:hypothetical protein